MSRILVIYYNSSDTKDKNRPSYVIISEHIDKNRHKIIQGGWNHTINMIYGLPTNKDYTILHENLSSYEEALELYPELQI